ncbi:MAG TPA: carboxypeptidase regulatory-like domain-containing protein [Vicinamibacterales bacterium]|nr:carboxypeptidase regulatory-like domain-containing protein [Vicinamibacterales bacterium]
MRRAFSAFLRRPPSPCVLLALGLLLLARPAAAQFRAGIQGTVTDATGLAVPGVTVVITNEETGVARETVTSETGFYRVAGLPPGRYRVVASLSGFKDTVVEHVVVTAEEIRGLDLTLQPGGLQETVTVTTTAPVLPTENADIGGTLTTVEIQRLPQIGRDPYELIRLTPGVFGLGMRDGGGNAVSLPNQVGPGGSNNSIFQTENQVPVTANGQRVEANNYQLDGVTAMSQAWGGAAVVTPNQESVKEIRVVSSPYSAEFGRNTGAQVQVVSQNGTNVFHGSAVFKRNTPGLNARQPWGGPHGERRQRVEQLLSQTAGSLGGPVRRDKLFFFFSFETLQRDRTELGTEWVETEELVNAIRTRRPNSLAAQALAFPGMTPRVVNVLERLDVGSITGAPGQRVTDPRGGGLDGVPDVQRVQLQSFNETTARQFNVRIDYALTPGDLVAFSTYFVPVTNRFNDASAWGNTTRPAGDFTSARRNLVGTLLWTRTLSPTVINEARFNVTRWYFDEVASNPDMPWGIPRLWVNQPARENVLLSFGPGVGPGVFYQTTYNFRNTLTKVTGSHAIKLGGEVIREQNNDRAPWAGRPAYNFDNIWSFANDAPSSEGTTFFDPTTGAFTDLAAYARAGYYALFVQDDWKLRPNVTLNLGLRWEYFTPLRSKNDRISNLVLGSDGGLIGARLQIGGNLYEPDRNNFGPQVGFAWTPTRFEDRLVVRGGVGVGYNRLPGSRLLESRFNPPFFAGFFLTGADILYAFASDPRSFNYPANPRARLTFDPATNLPTSGPPVNINATLQDLPNPYVYRYSIDAEYDLGGGWVAAIGYQGSTGNKLPRPVPYHLFVAPNPRIGSVNLLRVDAESQYNALITRATRRFRNGYMLSAEYRFGRSEDTCSSDHDCRQTYPFDQSTERGPSDYDVTHALKIFGTWDLPIFRDRTDVLGKVVGGWQLSGIVTASSGFPWTPVFGGPLCQVVVAGGGVCPQRPAAYTGGALEDTSDEVFMREFGQFPGGPLRYFTPPPSGRFDVPPRPGVGRNSFRGPRYFAVDAVLAKRFGLPRIPGLGDQVALEVRANAFNLFNNLNLRPFTFNSPSTQIENRDFGRATGALAGRVVELQARLSF